MRAHARWILTLALAAVLAGCAGEPAAAPKADPGSASPEVLARVDPDAGTGSVEGQAFDGELRALAGVNVELVGLGLATATDREGRFRLDEAPAGTWTLRAAATQHRPHESSVLIERGATTRVEITLEVLPSGAAHKVTQQFEGHFTCAHEMPLWTGDCMLLYKSLTGQNDTTTTESFAFRTLVREGWETIVLELVWTYAANNQLDGMRLYLENANGTAEGHSFKVGRTDGPENPLRLRVDRGVPHPRADYYVGTGVKAFIPDKGENAQIRVFPRGLLYEQTSLVCTNPSQAQGCLLGVGVGLGLRFTVHATVFYGERGPAEFTALA